MQRLVLAFMTAALGGLLLTSSALAKGAGIETITGPGVDQPLSFPREAQSIHIAQAAGIFPALTGYAPDPMLDERPAGDLGPRYTITWTLTVPGDEAGRFLQDVYPYARPNPVTYVEPGQPYFGTERARGGWFVASPVLKRELVAAGLPATAPAGMDEDGFPWSATSGVAVLAAALVLALVAVLVRRKRPRAATA
jgi:hypothetical protein